MNGDTDFYTVLGVAENASAAEIKRAYRRLAREHHPDRNPGDRGAEEKMKRISEAYDVLADPEKRARYDHARRVARSGVRAPAGVTFDTGGVDVEGIFGSLFGRAHGRRARGEDLLAETTISFEQSMTGGTAPVRVARDVACEACGGSGAAAGSAVAVCETCRGTGVVGEDQGLFSFRRACGACDGSGRLVATPCSRCAGDGMVRRVDEISVRIPAGVADGSKIRVRGRGATLPGVAQPGDLYVIVHVAPHPVFGRDGADVTLDLPLSFAEAALGSEVAIPTPDGPVRLKIPAGTQPGRTFRLRGRGAAKPKAGRGDLLATVRVVVPQTLTAAERDLLEAFRSTQADVRAHLGV